MVECTTNMEVKNTQKKKKNLTQRFEILEVTNSVAQRPRHSQSPDKLHYFSYHNTLRVPNVGF